MDRRDFLRSSLVAGSLAALGTGAAPAAWAAASPKSPQDPQHINQSVFLVGDDVPRYGRDTLARMDTILQARDKAGDFYLKGGAVTELEQRFARLLGKEDAAFLPTGTLANQVALRLLCGEKKRALVQQESHVYCDESDAVTTLSAINLVPLAPGRAAPTLEEVDAAIAVSDKAAYPLPIGAISLESPVRRADGAMVPFDTVRAIAERARAKGIGLHLDGARLLLNSGAEGFSAATYAAPFDTVYVSLYKYLGAPFGAILAGTKATIARARDARHIFGGTIFHGWQEALLALDGLDGFEERFAKARAAGDKLLDGLAKLDGYAVRRVENGTNIHFVDIAEGRRQGLQARLEKAGVIIGEPHDGRLALTFNLTLLRRSPEAIVKAFAG
jgi:threonine aldolase